MFALSTVFSAWLTFVFSSVSQEESREASAKYEHTALFYLKKCVVTTLEEVHENYNIFDPYTYLTISLSQHK